MAIKVSKEQVWAGTIEDVPGGLAKLLEALSGAGANLEFMIARRSPERPGQGVAFLTPIKGKKLQDAAAQAGVQQAPNVPTLRVVGPDKPGMGARMARAVADAGVNLRGVSAAVCGRNFIAFLGFDTQEDADKAAKALKTMDKAKPARR